MGVTQKKIHMSLLMEFNLPNSKESVLIQMRQKQNNPPEKK